MDGVEEVSKRRVKNVQRLILVYVDVHEEVWP